MAKLIIRRKTFNVILLIFGIIIISTIFFVLIFSNNSNSKVADNNQYVITDNGKQVLLMDARIGYKPNDFDVKAGIPSILRITTQNTYDCSSYVIIPSLNISKALPTTGTTDIDLGTQKSGTTINGSCSMGMYRFKIKFT